VDAVDQLCTTRRLEIAKYLNLVKHNTTTLTDAQTKEIKARITAKLADLNKKIDN
jgi:hypothetical protein